MGSGSEKKNDYDMGSYICSDKERIANMWCVRNKIYISPKARTSTEWYIVINMNGKDHVSPEAYKKTEVWKQLYKFSIYYHDKYNKVEKEQPKKEEKVVKKIKPKEEKDELRLF